MPRCSLLSLPSRHGEDFDGVNNEGFWQTLWQNDSEYWP